MKLIVTADDYGISDAVSDGILKCARDGVLTQTGLFSNMPGAKYAVDRMLRECPHVSLGQDINFVAGRPVTDPKLIPSMVQEDGSFKTSGMHRTLDKTEPNHIAYDEAYLETENQIKKFIELAGKKPDYLNGHSYGCDNTREAMKDVAAKYDIPLLGDMCEKNGIGYGPVIKKWNHPKGVLPSGKIDFSMERQLERDPLQLFIDGELEHLQKALDEDGIAHIHTHAGYVDKDIINRSSFTLIRAMEANFLYSDELVSWVKDNNVELTTFKELN